MRLILSTISIIVVIFGCSDDAIKPGVDTSLGTKEIPSQESWNAEIYFTEEGKLKAIVFADHLQKFEMKKTTYLEGVKIEFFNSDEEKTSTLSSKFGRVNDTTRDMYAIDSVVAVNDSAGTTLLTEELVWRNKSKKVTTDQFVTLISSKEKIEGYGFESDQSLDNYVIYKITYLTNLSEDESE
ncbi:LPS export ABC transporter periplasmic protein LptC [Bacteroidota bacterium]